MELIMTILATEQQPFVGTVLGTSMPTLRTSQATVVGINLDRHTLMQEGFVSDHAVQFGKAPLGVGGNGAALLFRGRFIAFPFLLALADPPPGSFTDMGQVFQADEAVGVLFDDALAHDMVSVLLQPSL